MKNLKELIKQIEKVEGVKLSISVPFDENKKMFDDYPYTTPISGNKTVDDLLYERVYPILNKVKNKVRGKIELKPKNNVVGYNTNDILLLCNNMEQMFYHFVGAIQNVTEIERIELISMFENTYIAGLIEQINIEEKKQKKVKKSRKVKKVEDNIENN